jgi:hypothetical protein
MNFPQFHRGKDVVKKTAGVSPTDPPAPVAPAVSPTPPETAEKLLTDYIASGAIPLVEPAADIAPAVKVFQVSFPDCAALDIEATDPDDAWKKYKEWAGILGTIHKPTVTPAPE